MSARRAVDRRRVLVTTVAGIAAIGVSGCTTRLGSLFAKKKKKKVASATAVTMTDDLVFKPSRVTIRAGQTVEWRNDSVLVHTVTADPRIAAKAADVALPAGAKPFNSGNIKPKGIFRHTFTTPGTYRYFCIPHEAAGMVGEVAVLP